MTKNRGVLLRFLLDYYNSVLYSEEAYFHTKVQLSFNLKPLICGSCFNYSS